MQDPANTRLCIGAWHVDSLTGHLSKGDVVVRLEARTMRLLMYLAERPGEVVSIDQLLSHVWSGVIVTPDSVYQGIAGLRRLLGDDPKDATYIATVPRLGYRMIATVGPWVDDPVVPLNQAGDTARVASPPPTDHPYRGIVLALIAVLSCAALIHLSAAKKSVAVLPFLDLTSQEMNEEYFADGLTEELIGDLSAAEELRVPAATSSFYFKGKQVAIGDVAQQLRVTFVVDGSVRKSGNLYRVAMRLVRANDGYVVYADTYDKPLGDLLTVQKTIASQAASAIRKAIADR